MAHSTTTKAKFGCISGYNGDDNAKEFYKMCSKMILRGGKATKSFITNLCRHLQHHLEEVTGGWKCQEGKTASPFINVRLTTPVQEVKQLVSFKSSPPKEGGRSIKHPFQSMTINDILLEKMDLLRQSLKRLPFQAATHVGDHWHTLGLVVAGW